MAKPLSILFVSSEVYPFAKTGGIADVSYALPLAIREIGHDIRVMLPKYGCISERKNRIHEINRLRDVPIPIGDFSEPATVKSSSIANPRVKVQAYITTNHRYYDSKKGLYADPATGEDYSDNDERFIFFARSVVHTCLLLGWFPDIIHCNDWHTALVPMYMRKMYPQEFRKTKTIFTIHNFSQQGVFPAKSIAKAGFPADLSADLKHKNQMNFLKAGILHSDRLTTVSPTYAKEILKDKNIGNGLNTCLKEKENIFTGIRNGIDTLIWNPRKDTKIPKQYDENSIEKKSFNKQALCEKFGFHYDANIPVVGMVTRLAEQKGIPLLIEAAKELLKENIQFVLLGEGDQTIQHHLEKLSKDYPNKFHARFTFDDDLAHLIEAGADIFLMPSQHEPCGLGQMYALAYGTIPVVHATGGLVDTVFEFDPATGEGNGILFHDYNISSLLAGIQKAISYYQNKELWHTLIRNGMLSDNSWNQSAKQYEEIYRGLMKE